MPKMKTKSGAKKRFSLTGTGKIKRKHAYKSHILTKKATKRKRALTHTTTVADTDRKNILLCLGMK
ncbi:MAG: 50S ribosomal protein L35 [Bacteroidales bacterium]|jgi:large subunit ribosomal protein L35|nr:50S ribosomal protein L35 [Bacteroidales bacterium]MCK9499300.1 50S ribosomal protein L35 [Bacteroidales bacterium]MDY0313657.1 50S ribosomal protein L35 [Bacteroidales bacterium]NLB85947.1 50S ribosomal protein L35 [Bacteroidales bacterium]